MDTALLAEECERIDLLDRQEFVDRILTITEALSNNRKNACFAVNGQWGVGKSFVLDMFEEQAQEIGQEGQELPRYLIFRYNCWEYDYYDEPLVAIVASILDQIDEKEKLLLSDNVTKIRAIIKEVGKGLAKKAIEIVGDKTGIDFDNLAEIMQKGAEASKEEIQEAHEYDSYFNFKKNLKKLQEAITSLTTDQTVIFVVDELDRCLPEYTIKVLERLHHLFNGVPNVQVILSIDMGQLEHTVKQIFGEQTDAKQYLRKFIDFELKLEVGIVKDHFDRKFFQYTKRFEITSATTSAIEVEEYKSYILNGLDMRSRISVVDRCEMLHSILIGEEVLDASYMCLEILLVILKDSGIDVQKAKDYFSIDSVFSKEYIGMLKNVPDGLVKLSDHFKVNRTPNSAYKLYWCESGSFPHVNVSCLMGKLLCAYRSILGYADEYWPYPTENPLIYASYAEKYWDLLQLIN